MKKLIFLLFFAHLSTQAQRTSLLAHVGLQTGLFCAVNAPVFSLVNLMSSDSKINNKSIAKSLEDLFRSAKERLQYKYIARPVYKTAGGKENPLISVPVAFAVTDLVMHRLFPHSLVRIFCGQGIPWKIHTYGFVGWVALSIPLALYKYDKIATEESKALLEKKTALFAQAFHTDLSPA